MRDQNSSGSAADIQVPLYPFFGHQTVMPAHPDTSHPEQSWNSQESAFLQYIPSAAIPSSSMQQSVFTAPQNCAIGTSFPSASNEHPQSSLNCHVASSAAHDTSTSTSDPNAQVPAHENESLPSHSGDNVYATVRYPDALLDRVIEASENAGGPDFPWDVYFIDKNTTPSTIVTVDHNEKLHIPGVNRNKHLIYSFGYPESDSDMDLVLHEMEGMSTENFDVIYRSLDGQLKKIRETAKKTVTEFEDLLALQHPFRFLSVSEVKNIIRIMVENFCKARDIVFLKYRSYSKNMKWIENLSGRPRIGYLTPKQNNTLRGWFFDHFDHPYISAQERRELAQKTNLRGDQINNWLVNARSRVWRPTCEILCPSGVRAEMNRDNPFSNLKASLEAFEEGWQENPSSEVDTTPPGPSADHQGATQSESVQGGNNTSGDN